jgi:hypothetical protein
MKVLFVYDAGDDFAWLQSIGGNRWIDKTFATIVTVEEATSSEKEDLLRRASSEKLKRLVAKQVEPNKGTGEFDGLEFVSVTYDEQHPDRYDSGTYVGIVVKRPLSGDAR